MLLICIYLPCPSRTFGALIPVFNVRNREVKSQRGCSVRLLPYYPVTTPGVCPVQMLADDLDIYGSPGERHGRVRSCVSHPLQLLQPVVNKQRALWMSQSGATATNHSSRPRTSTSSRQSRAALVGSVLMIPFLGRMREHCRIWRCACPRDPSCSHKWRMDKTAVHVPGTRSRIAEVLKQPAPIQRVMANGSAGRVLISCAE